jgi:hypothetical protein
MKARPITAAAMLAVLTIVAASATLAPSPGSAQQPAAPGAQRERPLPSRHVEGRIAFLRAELKITDAEQARWEHVAAAMRASARQMDQMAQQMRATRDQPRNAVQDLERRAQLAETRASADKTFLAAFKPLYDSLSADQKQSADELFERSFRHGARRR